MDAPLTVAVCRTLAEHGVATLRFNFRPFSEGATEAGGSACIDTAAALKTLTAWRDVRSKRCGVVGYSAGAAAVARGASALKGARAFVLVAPPLSSVRPPSRFGDDARPKLVIVGANDKIADAQELEAAARNMKRPAQLARVEDADHTMRRHESEVADLTALFLGEWLRK
jgi:alpha/beta superfamily hydrolase